MTTIDNFDENIKVVWDTLQYLQGLRDSKKMITTRVLKISKTITVAPKIYF